MNELFFSNSWVDDSISDCSIFCTDYQINYYSDQLYESLGIYLPARIRLATKKRKAEFLAGRYAVKQCIQILGGAVSQNAFSIHAGVDRAPIWPREFTGSITHTDDKACAIVARAEQYHAIGVDIETSIDTCNFNELKQQILTSNEESFLQTLDKPFGQLGTLVFSAKESLFKALYPFVGEYFDFKDVEVSEICMTTGVLKARLLRTLGSDCMLEQGRLFEVKFSLEESFVYTRLLLKR